MTTIRDLSPLYGAHENRAPNVFAVGWLGADVPYDCGTVSRAFYDHLKHLMVDPFQPYVSLGFHKCELCQFDGAMGSRNLFVPTGEFIFVCPELILHYVATHRYRPPKAFQDAVMQCPIPGGAEYRRLFLESGGRALMELSTPAEL